MGTTDFEGKLERYADAIVKVGLNLQPGQRLLIGSSRFGRYTPLIAAPLVRVITKKAYQAGATLVDVLWQDPQLEVIRLENAPKDSFAEYSEWRAQANLDAAERGDALLVIYAHDPDLLGGQDQDALSTLQRTDIEHNRELLYHITNNTSNWSIVAAAAPAWAQLVFPDLPAEQAVAKLWDVIFEMCRVDTGDPVANWETHIKNLRESAAYLNAKRYDALKLRAPGTDLSIGLVEGHLWLSAGADSHAGNFFVPNLPTEEVFTMPHKDRIDGVVTASKPLNRGGVLIKDFTLTFENGHVTHATARQGETILKRMIETDKGASSLGEIALVPYQSPISQSGLLFYNTLFDENAASHIALGQAYPMNLMDSDGLSVEEMATRGVNNSDIHIDFMIGSDEMDVDGIWEDGTTEAVMRNGEWVF